MYINNFNYKKFYKVIIEQSLNIASNIYKRKIDINNIYLPSNIHYNKLKPPYIVIKYKIYNYDMLFIIETYDYDQKLIISCTKDNIKYNKKYNFKIKKINNIIKLFHKLNPYRDYIIIDLPGLKRINIKSKFYNIEFGFYKFNYNYKIYLLNKNKYTKYNNRLYNIFI